MKEKEKEKKNNVLSEMFITQTKGYSNVYPKRAMWKEISEDLKGEFKISHNSGYELEKLSLKLTYKNYIICLSESDTKPLKFDILFQDNINYDLLIYKEDALEKFLKKIGKKEVEINKEAFDKQYIIKSNNSEKTIGLLTNEISDKFLNNDVYSMSIAKDRSQKSARLTTVVSRLVDDKKTILDLINMHIKLIDRLIEISII
jgi:hypothetical protein